MSNPEKDAAAERLIATPYPSSFSFDTTFSVIIPHTIDKVFALLSNPANLQRILECQVQLGVSDFVLMRDDIAETIAEFTSDGTKMRVAAPANSTERGYPRQFFHFMSFNGGGQGAGTYTSDLASYAMLYETVQDG